jgi:hypothetical protein
MSLRCPRDDPAADLGHRLGDPDAPAERVNLFHAESRNSPRRIPVHPRTSVRTVSRSDGICIGEATELTHGEEALLG